MEHSDAQVGALDQGESAIWKVNSMQLTNESSYVTYDPRYISYCD